MISDIPASTEEVNDLLTSLLKKGAVTIIGIDENGEPEYKITPAGEQAVKNKEM